MDRPSRRTSRAGSPAWPTPRSSAGSTRRRRSTPDSTRSAARPRSTACRALARPVRVDGQPVQGLQPCLCLLLRPADARVPRPRRGPRLREGDHRQGQRARGAAQGAGAAVVVGRARRDGHEHRPVPVGRGPLQAHARDLGGAARRRQPVLGPDEVAADAARPRPAAGGRASAPRSARACRCRRSTRAWRASEPHTPHPRARLEAVAKLNAAGIPTGMLIAPLLPGINDAPEQVERIIALATEAGATSIGGQTLFLHGAMREIYFDWLRVVPAGPGAALRAALRARRPRCRSASAGRSSARRGCARCTGRGGAGPRRTAARPPPVSGRAGAAGARRRRCARSRCSER